MPAEVVTPEVVVIGAGFAGLSAATALAERGLRLLVLEARGGLGGRATAFEDPVTGERVDNGQHALFGCYHETFRFLRRVGTDRDVVIQPSLTVEVVDSAGQRTTLRCPSLPSPLHLLGGVMRWRALSLADRVAALRLGPALRALRRRAGEQGRPLERSEPAPEETVRTWLQRQGQTPRLIDLLWDPLAVAALNESIDVAAAQPFGAVLANLLGPDPRDSALALPGRPLDELYAEPARSFLEGRGCRVLAGHVARVARDADGPFVVAGPLVVRPRAIVCAVPWHALPDVLADAGGEVAFTRASASRVVPRAIVTANVWLDGGLDAHATGTGGFVGLPGRTFQWMFDKRRIFRDGASHLSLVASAADDVAAKENAEVRELALAELHGALPDTRAAMVRRVVIVRERRATFSVAPGAPPRPSTETSIRGLYLAGDWIDTGLPATIEGAVVSGHRAADRVLRHLGAPLQQLPPP